MTALLRLLFVVLTVAALCFSGAGCDDRSAAGGPLQEVRIGYFANATHAQAVLGIASGDFARAVAPAKVTTRVFNAGPALIEALNAGEIDFAYVGPGPAISAHARSRGDALRVVAGAAANGVVLVARPGSGIRSLDDLKGRRIATPQAGNTQDISARHFLSQKFGDAGLAGILPVPNAEQANLMARGQIDAAWVPEPWGAYLVSQANATIIAQEKDLWPQQQFVLTLVVTTPQFLQHHGDAVKKLLSVHQQWTAKLQSDPQAQVGPLGDALFALTQKRLPPGVLKDAMGRIRFTNEPLPASLQAMAQWTNDLGFVRRPVNLNGLIDTSLLQSPAPAAQ